MKPLSESLETLAGRVKTLEDSATATFEADRAKLEKRRHEIDEAFKSDVSEVGSAARTWWNETKTSMKRPLDELQGRVDKRQSEHELHRALRTADAAEENAVAAIELATYFLTVAE